MAALKPLRVPLLGPPRIEKAEWAPNGSVHESDTATEPPPWGPVAETLLQTGLGGAKSKRRPGLVVVARCTDHRRLAVRCERNGAAEEAEARSRQCRSGSAAVSTRLPDRVKMIGGADVRGHALGPDQRGVPVGRKRDRASELRRTARCVGTSFVPSALHGRSGSCEHPRCAPTVVVSLGAADQGRVAVERQRQRRRTRQRAAAALGKSSLLWVPGRAGAACTPRPPRLPDLVGPPIERGVAIGRERDSCAVVRVGCGAPPGAIFVPSSAHDVPERVNTQRPATIAGSSTAVVVRASDHRRVAVR